jgi:hypothetical protein
VYDALSEEHHDSSSESRSVPRYCAVLALKMDQSCYVSQVKLRVLQARPLQVAGKYNANPRGRRVQDGDIGVALKPHSVRSAAVRHCSPTPVSSAVACIDCTITRISRTILIKAWLDCTSRCRAVSSGLCNLE